MAKFLTDAAVRKYRGGRRRREIRDGGAQGLYLVVQPSGAKSWALRYRRPGGKAAKLTLGPVDFSGREPKEGPVLGDDLSTLHLSGDRTKNAWALLIPSRRRIKPGERVPPRVTDQFIAEGIEAAVADPSFHVDRYEIKVANIKKHLKTGRIKVRPLSHKC